MKLFPPASALSQNPSKRYEGSPTGAFAEPERLTPRNRRVRPWESTKLPSTVCTKFGGGRSPVAGETKGIFGMLLRCPGEVMEESKEKKGDYLRGQQESYHPSIFIRVRVYY
jgi:hypothetical protein